MECLCSFIFLLRLKIQKGQLKKIYATKYIHQPMAKPAVNQQINKQWKMGPFCFLEPAPNITQLTSPIS